MIIPIRCFTCGKTLADKWNAFEKRSKDIDREYEKWYMEEYLENVNDKDAPPPFRENVYKNIEPKYKNKILDDLGLVRMCCRRHMLSHVDMMGKI